MLANHGLDMNRVSLTPVAIQTQSMFMLYRYMVTIRNIGISKIHGELIGVEVDMVQYYEKGKNIVLTKFQESHIQL